MPKHPDACKAVECELRHCKCGRHNFEPGETCDSCQVEVAAEETEAITRNFGGNYEKAAQFMGW